MAGRAASVQGRSRGGQTAPWKAFSSISAFVQRLLRGGSQDRAVTAPPTKSPKSTPAGAPAGPQTGWAATTGGAARALAGRSLPERGNHEAQQYPDVGGASGRR